MSAPVNRSFLSSSLAPSLRAAAIALVVAAPALAAAMPPQAAPAPVGASGAIHRPAPAATGKPGRAAPPDYKPVKNLTIATGEIMVLPVAGKVVRLALGSGSVLSTTTVDNNLLLIAEQPGNTSLLVWTAGAVHSYNVQVTPKNLQDLRAKVDLLIRDLNGVKVEQLGTELVLSGVAHKEALVQLSAALKDSVNLVFNVREDHGLAYTKSVLFRLHFIEVKRSLLEKIGVEWAKNANGPVFGYTNVARATGIYRGSPQAGQGDNLLAPVPEFLSRGGANGGMFLGLATTITSRLNLGVSDGEVRLLASPELTARSGGKARLQVGGEVPIPLAGALGATTVEYKNYGIILSIEPFIDAAGTITAKISTELSQIDPAVTVAGIPGFLTRNTTTEVSMKQGETIALGGLVTSEMSSAVDRVPGLSRIPILGRLFRSDDFRNSKSELVVLLEPEIITAGDGLAQQLRDRGEGLKQGAHDEAKQLREQPYKFRAHPTDSDGK